MNETRKDKRLTYKDAGVDVQAGQSFVNNIRSMVEATHRPEVIGPWGAFSGFFRPRLAEYLSPVLVSSTDGVGTKLKIAFTLNRHDSVGIDLVAMCVNDLACQGAEPLFFLDYLATGKLEQEVALEIIKGITIRLPRSWLRSYWRRDRRAPRPVCSWRI